MKERILGIDTGTNSIGWSIVDYDSEAKESKYTLIEKGVNIFQEGVKIEKGIESSRASERTEHRRLRIGYWRRKVRKIAVLRILIENNLCPHLSLEQLKAWRSKKNYPLDDAFMLWQRTDEAENKNPYYYRHLCLTEKLDLQQERNRHILGRAIYHINQRRGFLSNRKEDTKESDGKVTTGITDLTKSMQESGVEYLGEYFYRLYQGHEKIRNHYTSRLEHYEKELLKICEMQDVDNQLSKGLTDRLRRTIITQRPLKSQKHSVGRCVYEPNKHRCPVSHPLYEQYRMYQFINSIRFGAGVEDLRPLTAEEKALITPLFLRKSKKEFKFKEIAEKLAGKKKSVGYFKDRNTYDCRVNSQLDTSVSGCPVIANLSDVFGVKNNVDDWLDKACEKYTLAGKKNRFEIMNDIWHALFFFEDADKLKAWTKDKLQLDEKQAEAFSKIHIPSDYASLSLKAIRKILPYMKQYGMIYSHAVFMANLTSVVPLCEMDSEALLPMLPREDADNIVGAFLDYDDLRKKKMTEINTKEEYVKQCVINHYQLCEEGEIAKLKKLYHPSMIDAFPKVLKETEGGYFQLGSPRTNSMRNPMAMHSLFRIRHVVNTLLREGKIDKDTIIHIEFARELHSANMRRAISIMNKANEKDKNEAADEIKKLFGENYKPSEDEVLKYLLWKEQGARCLYTGKTISLTDLFDSNKFDIEHTIPRSVGGDSTDMNLTVCDSEYNRKVKRTLIPSQLANHEEILERISHWNEEIVTLEKKISREHDIVNKHVLRERLKYLKGKYERFTMTEVPDGFSLRQGADAQIIARYARLYLKSLFSHVYVVKGRTTAEFRKMWGLQEEYTKKERVNHCHHAIDAITIACIGKAEYDELAQFLRKEELHKRGESKDKPHFPKPWATFTQDIKHIEDSLLVSHYTADNMGKQTRKKVRKNGKLTGDLMQGDTARSSLHQDTYYGAIERDGEIRYVVRKPVDVLEEKDFKNIVDDAVRQKVQEAFDKYRSLKKAVEADDVWMNREKGIRINKVRIYAAPTAPLSIRKHRDVSTNDYKRTYYVVNDSNYIMGIYENAKGKRKFHLVNCLNATKHFNAKGQNEGLLPLEKEGCPLRWKIKIGTMVILYDKSPDEIYYANSEVLCKRLYKVYALEIDGRLRLKHHQDARMAKEAKDEKSSFSQITEVGNRLRISLSNFNALVEGQDFTMNDLGEITFLNHD